MSINKIGLSLTDRRHTERTGILPPVATIVMLTSRLYRNKHINECLF